MPDTKILLPESEIPRSWYNMLADAPTAAAAAAAPRHRPADRPRRPGAALPDRPDPAGGLDRARDRRSPRRCSTCCGCGGRRRSTARTGWSGRSARARASTTSTRASARPGRTSRTRPSPRPTTTPGPAARRIATETGAGQWGSSMAFACSFFGLECKVYMVRRLLRPEALPADDDGDLGRRGRAQPVAATPTPGAASSSATPTRPAASASPSRRRSRTPPPHDDTSYSLGSVLNHVLLHQTVIGQEAQRQLALAGERGVDVVIGCVGGGSNFARPRAAVRAREDRRRRHRDRSPASRPPARRSPAALSPTTSATPPS